MIIDSIIAQISAIYNVTIVLYKNPLNEKLNSTFEKDKWNLLLHSTVCYCQVNIASVDKVNATLVKEGSCIESDKAADCP